MPRLVKLAAFVLLAAWLPATLHCELETAGVELHGVTHEHHAGDHHHHPPCAEDSCHSLDGVSYRGPVVLLKVPPPPADFVILFITTCPSDVAAPVLSPSRHPPPLELAQSWRFVVRAAPPVRAPSLLDA